MSLNIDQALQSAGGKTPDWLVEQRDAACNDWAATVLPSRKTEQWKYTSIKPLQQTFTAAPIASPSQDELEKLLPDLGGLRLVFVNGHWLSELSSSPEALATEGLTLVRFSEATAEQSDRIAAGLGRATPDQGHPFIPLNLAALDNGIFIEVADGASIHAPIQVVSLTMGGKSPFAVNTRLLVWAGVNSAVTIVEHFADAGACASFTNSVTELLLAPGATVNHCRLNLEEGHALHVGGVHAKLERDATLNGFYLGLGADLKRVDLVANMEGAGAHAEMNGIYCHAARSISTITPVWSMCRHIALPQRPSGASSLIRRARYSMVVSTFTRKRRKLQQSSPTRICSPALRRRSAPNPSSKFTRMMSSALTVLPSRSSIRSRCTICKAAVSLEQKQKSCWASVSSMKYWRAYGSRCCARLSAHCSRDVSLAMNH
jgi:hypothetical protein